MATTTNYGWTTPDDTALVKDGAAAIRTLGSSVDTTTKALNPSTTLGDVEYRSSTANTNTRLGIGTTGQVLTVSGGVPAWATPASGAYTLLSTTTLSGTSTTISTINQTYKHLYLVGVGISTSANTDNYFRLNSDTAGNYYNALSQASQGTVSGATTTGATRAVFGASPSNSNPYQFFFEISIPRYSLTEAHCVYYRSHGLYGSTRYSFTGSTAYDSTTAISDFTILTDAAQTYSTGTIYTYGVN